jgi:hypothetical protein
VRLRVLGRAGGQFLFGATVQFRLQLFRDALRNFTLDRKNIGQLAIVGVGPKMRVIQRIDQLHIDAHLIGRLLHAALQDIRDPQLFGDFAQIIRRALIFLGGRSRDDLEIANLGQARQNFVLHAFAEISVLRIVT